jgi:putative hydrolase of the HAD superfamily
MANGTRKPTSSYAVRSFTGADYEGLLDYVLNA